jgi:hypothetical protein
VFTARYALGPYIKQTRFVFKGLIPCIFPFLKSVLKYVHQVSLSSKSSAPAEIWLDRHSCASVRASVPLYESNYCCIRICSYVLIMLLCVPSVDTDTGKDGVGKMCLVMLMKIWFLWKIVCSHVIWTLELPLRYGCPLASAVCWHLLPFLKYHKFFVGTNFDADVCVRRRRNFISLLYGFVFTMQPQNLPLFSSTCVGKVFVDLVSPLFLSVSLSFSICLSVWGIVNLLHLLT